jgi:hypothetical protein
LVLPHSFKPPGLPPGGFALPFAMRSRLALFFLLIVPATTLVGVAAVGVMVAILANFEALVTGMTAAGIPSPLATLLLALGMLVAFAGGLGIVSAGILVAWRRVFAAELRL